MNLNRDNYEEFFLLYVDNELTAVERKLVEAFVQANTDLAEELNMLQASKLRPETSLIFENKKNLLKQEGEISIEEAERAEELFLLYIDGELDETGISAVESLAASNPYLLNSLEILLQTRLQADPALRFEGKEILLRKDPGNKIRMMGWIRLGAAAFLLFVAGYYFLGHRVAPRALAVSNPRNSVKAAKPGEEKKNQPIVTPAPVDSLNQIAGTEEGSRKESKIPNPSKHEKNDRRPGIQSPAKETRMNNYVTRDPSLEENIGDNTIGHPVSLPSRETSLLDSGKKSSAFEGVNPLPASLVAKSVHIGIREPLEATTENSTGEVDYALSSDDEKKNRMRGLFRKISRVLDKTTRVDPNNKKRGLRIGNYQIALK